MALAAQGFARPRPPGSPSWRAQRRVIERLGLLQLDSVNVLVRAHYLPLFSRLGPYERALIDRRALCARADTLFEYWAHEASLLPVELHPLFRWRMARAARLEGTYAGLAAFARDNRAYVEATYAQVVARGPITAAELAEPGRRSGSWWGWHDGKAALEHLFWAGRLTTASRRGFERVYDLPERVLPRQVLELPTPPENDAIRALLRHAALALGVATAADLRDYFRLKPADALPRLAELVEEGTLLPVTVEGWRQPAFLAAGASLPRRVAARCLIAPFDPLIWERDRAERLFGFRYRLEIYTPAPRRVFGYYVLPLLLGDRLVARVDLKAARTEGVLDVLAAHLEPAVDQGEVAEALAVELGELARWLGTRDGCASPRMVLSRSR